MTVPHKNRYTVNTIVIKQHYWNSTFILFFAVKVCRREYFNTSYTEFICVWAYNIVVKHQFHWLLLAIFDDPGFEFGLGQGEKGLHVVFVLQEFHLCQVDAGRCRDKVDPKKKTKNKQTQSSQTISDLPPDPHILFFQWKVECEIMPSEVVDIFPIEASCLLPFRHVLELIWRNRDSINTSVLMDPLKYLLVTLQAP